VRRLTFSLSVLALSLVSVPALSARQGPGTRSSQKAQMFAEVQSLPTQPVHWANADGAPIVIQVASAREISGSTYLGLTGGPTIYASMSTYPDIALLNTSGKTITSFAIMLDAKADKHVAIIKNLSIAPGGAYTLVPRKWLLEDKVTVQNDDGTSKSVMRKPGPDSVKFWLSGAPPDLHVAVARVWFEDGTQWKWPANFDF
jgi:hypothetical protein